MYDCKRQLLIHHHLLLYKQQLFLHHRELVMFASVVHDLFLLTDIQHYLLQVVLNHKKSMPYK